ncbi:MAG: tetratricopeptide repeat protein [Deltaproteobacteria bacterium]|nr:tetratricopeptide repeat protein [Deltaproteobacteria bacterium]
MDLKVQLYAEDWLDKSNRTIDSAKRLSILEQGYHLIPDDRGLRQRLIDEYISQKLWKKAASMLEVLAEKDSDLEIIGELLSIYRAMSDKDGMISALKRIIALAPDDSDARSQLAEILEETGNITMAIEENQALLKRVSKTEKLPIYKTLGYLYSKTGKDKNAISSYLEAVKLDETDANLYFNLSYLYEKIHQDEKAYYFLEKAIKLKPGDEEGLLKLARWLSSKGDFSDSLKYLNDILLKNPKNIEAHYLTAQIMEKQGKKQELKKVYKDILNLDPDNETVIYNLGSLEYESGNLKEGLKYFRIYSKLHPKDISIHEIIFDIYQKLKDEEMAFKQAQILVDLNSKRLALYQFIFNYLNARAGFDMIIDIMEKGSKSNPDQIELMEYLVFAYLKTGDDERAIKQMEKIVQIKPADINRWMQIAKLKEKNNEFSDALKAYKKVLDLSPNHEDAQEGYLRLRLKGIQHE